MSRLAFLDRLQTIVITATVTSAVWIVVGTAYVGRDAAEPMGGSAASTPAARSIATEKALPGQPAPAGGLLVPVVGVSADRLTDSFADDRGGRPHEAIDIMAPAGTPVIAAGSGTAEKLFRSESGGNTIYVRSPDRRTIHYYAHLEAYAPGLSEGQTVGRGQRLGAVGATGNADPAAPHLHFAVLQTDADAHWWEPAGAIDPFPLFARP